MTCRWSVHLSCRDKKWLLWGRQSQDREGGPGWPGGADQGSPQPRLDLCCEAVKPAVARALWVWGREQLIVFWCKTFVA